MKPMLTLRERMRADRRRTAELGETSPDGSSVSTRIEGETLDRADVDMTIMP